MEARKTKKQPVKMRLDRAIDTLFSSIELIPTPASEIPILETLYGLPVDIAEQHGRMVSIALACYGNREMAYRAIDRAFEMWEQEQEPITLETSVGNLFKIRMTNSLEKGGVGTVKELLTFSVDELMRIANISHTTAVAIDNVLQKHGLGLRKSLD